ncbi:MAG: DNA repair protein RecO [Candidatus Izemoplasma sp.]
MEYVEGIVLKSIDYKDASKILYLYTKDGNHSMIAHSVKKMNNLNRFLSQPCNKIKYTHTKSAFPSLKEAELLKNYEAIKSDLICYAYVNHMFELVKNTISDDLDHHKMYNFVIRLLTLFEALIDPEILTFIFELKLLHFLGNGLNFKACSICSKTDNLVFSIDYGGLVCSEHLDTHQERFNAQTYNIIKKLYYIDIDEYYNIEIDKFARVKIRQIINQFYDQYVSYRSKSLRIIKQLQKY